jgi:hypothetical protein
MAVQETQAPRAAVSTVVSAQPSSAPVTRSSLSVALATPISGGELVSARLFVDGRGHHGGGHHGGGRPHGPYRPYPYPAPYPGPYYPIPIPVPVPLPGAEHRCAPWEIGQPGSYRDIFGNWWCRDFW